MRKLIVKFIELVDRIVPLYPILNERGFTGGTDVEAPELSAEERELINQQIDLLGLSAGTLEALQPEIMRQLRFKETTVELPEAEATAGRARLTEIEKERAQLLGDAKATALQMIKEGKSRTEQDTVSLSFKARDEALEAEATSLQGQLEPTSTFERMTFPEYIESLDPDEREVELIKQTGRQDLLRLLRGDEEAVPGINAILDRQRQQTHEGLIRRGIEPGSTAYANAMAETEQGLTLTEESLRTGRFGQSQAAALGVPIGTDPAAGLNIAALGLGGSSPLGTLAGVREGQFQADIFSAQAAAQQESSIWGSLAYLGGTAIAASSREYKEDIEEFDNKIALDLIRETPIRTFKYKDGIEDSDYHIGMITEESPEEIVTRNKKAIKLYDSIGLAIAALKRVDERVSKLEEGKE